MTARADGRARRATAVLCALLVTGTGWALHRATHGFEIWTFEAHRRQQIVEGTLKAPPLVVNDSAAQLQVLWNGTPRPAVWLVDFIYTQCDTVCMALGSDYLQMQRALSSAGAPGARVNLLSLSFDPRDDASRLTRYAHLHGADPRHWTVAAPADPRQTTSLLQSLGVVVVPDGLGGFVHNGEIHLIDERGILRGLFERTRWPDALAAARTLADPAPGTP